MYGLPLELLQEIFIYCIDPPARASATVAPLQLCHVCTYWRVTALAMPTLWSSLSVAISSIAQVSLVSTWLERSAPSPLSITLTWTRPSEALDQILSRLGSDIYRLQMLDLTSSSWFLPRPTVPSPATNSALMLKTLRVAMPLLNSVMTMSDFSIWLKPYIRAAPNLTDIVWRAPTDVIPWNQLVRIDVQSMMLPSMCLRALQVATFATHFSARVVATSRISNATATPQPHVVLPHLRRLRLSIFKSPGTSLLSFRTFFEGITAPALQNLSIITELDNVNWKYVQPGCWPFSEIEAFLFRSSCSLTSLAVGDMALPDEEVIQFLGCQYFQETLLHLEVGFCPTVLADRFLKFLTCSEPPYSLPRLVSVHLWNTYASAGRLADMLESRRVAHGDDTLGSGADGCITSRPAQLERVVLDLTASYNQAEDTRGISELIQGGLQVIYR